LEGISRSDLAHWQEIAVHKNQASLDKTKVEDCWKIMNPQIQDVFFQHLRIRQTGPNSEDKHFLVNSGIDFYGHVRIHKLNLF
jgi:hypothetical protein